MGWKNVKEHYRIEHQVQVTSEGICIGSPYIHNLIVVNADGKVKKRFDRNSNEDLKRIQQEMDDDPALLRKLVLTADTFDKSITVYTYEGGEIVECKCENLGWPNVTHGGAMMYENTFSDDKDKVVTWAKQEAAAGVKNALTRIEQIRATLVEWEDRLCQRESELDRLATDYPE